MSRDDQEWFHLGPRLFDVAKAKRILSDIGPHETKRVPPSQLAGLLVIIDVDVDAADALPDAALDEPLICVNDNGNALLIDGYHRLYAAVQRSRESLTLHVLSPDQSQLVEISDPTFDNRHRRGEQS